MRNFNLDLLSNISLGPLQDAANSVKSVGYKQPHIDSGSSAFEDFGRTQVTIVDLKT